MRGNRERGKREERREREPTKETGGGERGEEGERNRESGGGNITALLEIQLQFQQFDVYTNRGTVTILS